MVWSYEHDVMLTREILVVDPFTGTKKGTVARGAKWGEIAANLCEIQHLYFKVDKRAVRDRYSIIATEFKARVRREENATGIDTESTEMTEVELALEDIVEREEEAEKTQQEESDSKRAKDVQDRANATEMRCRAMEKLGGTQKRKAEENKQNVPKKKRRSNGNDTLVFIREKNERAMELKKEEIELQRKQLDVESKKHDDFMQMMANMQQQQQKQQQEFQASMAMQTKQHNDFMLSIVSKLLNK